MKEVKIPFDANRRFQCSKEFGFILNVRFLPLVIRGAIGCP
jgi:hypothetical protein